MLTDALIMAGLNALVVVLLMTATAVAARRTGRWAVVDVTWGLGFIAVALVSALAAPLVLDGVGWLPWLLLVLVGIWAGRLASHIFTRGRGHGEDPRYEALKQRNPSFAKAVLLPQGVAMWFVSLPVQLAAIGTASITWLIVVGVLVFAIGLFFESTGDAQLKAFKADPANKGKVMDQGLWRYTRHPNYFGDATVWWGLFLVAAASGLPAAATVLSPIAMSFFLVFATGAKLLEREMMKRPGYPEYAERTSMFVPLPPKRQK